MGKKGKKGTNLGKALIRSKFHSSNRKYNGDISTLHSVDVNDGYDWARLNLQSVTEESSFEEFLSTAELAGTEFHAEKLNIKFINPQSNIGLLSKEEKKEVLKKQKENEQFLKIPRRPKWDSSTTAEELQTREKQEFLEWRRQLTLLQEVDGIMLTPYEKNLEFWRQLWRVLERSDIIVQIVDARNPLFFRCEDLETYVKEIDQKKQNVILINKADFLTVPQRQSWAEYFTSINVQIVFFSAIFSIENKSFEEESESRYSEDSENESEDEYHSLGKDSNSVYNPKSISESDYESADDYSSDNECQSTTESNDNLKPATDVSTTQIDHLDIIQNSPEILKRDELLSFFKKIYKNNTVLDKIITVGMVGYPNVGKSSTINTLIMDKKVSVSATPGKTKHFQTLFLDKDLLLCDCPGLVMPKFVCTKAEMILNGVLPIDQMRDHVPPITLLGTLIPKHVIEDLYGIMLPLPPEEEDPDRPPTAEEILNIYGFNRGFMTHNGQPNNPRSARYILKDFVSGKLLYCVAPPTKNQQEFHVFPARKRVISANKHIPSKVKRINQGNKITSNDLDEAFLKYEHSTAHVKGIPGKAYGVSQNSQDCIHSVTKSTQNLRLEEKPWKKINKHCNKKKHEKTRKLYAHLDLH